MKSLFRKYNNIHKAWLKMLLNEINDTRKHKRHAAFNKYYTENK